jgi:hypothetical protein
MESVWFWGEALEVFVPLRYAPPTEPSYRVFNGYWEATFREWYPGFRAAPQPMAACPPQNHTLSININVRTLQPWSAIRLAMDVKGVQRGIAPGEDDLERRMERRQRHVAANEKPALDERTDPLQNDATLIDMGWGHCMLHGRSIPQGNPDLKCLPPEANALEAAYLA